MKKRETVGIRILTGENRKRIQEEVKKALGEEYEVFEGENLGAGELEGVFLGATLFSVGARKILIKDLGEKKENVEALVERIEEYGKTENEVVIWETKIDKRLGAVKKLAKAGIKIEEFAEKKIDTRAMFDVYDIAKRDGGRAVRELEKIEGEQDPYMFIGLMIAQALRELKQRPNGARERRALRELAELDMKTKTTGFEPWVLIKAFLIRQTS